MGSSLKSGAVLVALVWAAACGETPEYDEAQGDAGPTPQSQLPDEVLLRAVKVGLPPAGVTRADLPDPDSQGAQLVERYCGETCHGLPSPGTHSASDWPGTVRRMWMRIDRVSDIVNVEVPDAAQRIVLLRYLLDNALVVSEATLPEGPGLAAFTGTCNRCHALPDPKQHSPADWPAVVLRMKVRIEEMLGVTLRQDELQRIVRYLETASESLR